jgi:hypothetical protein|tara:strand:+ start:80 stop:337 length:258 start_codon:yes stop_codon:yes gene_type:complete
MQIDMTKFINDYLEREGITPNKAQELRHKINEGMSLDQFNEEEFKAIKTMCGADMLNNSELRGLVLMMCNDELGIKYEEDKYEDI